MERNQRYGTPLCLATEQGSFRTVKLLVERKDVDVNLPNNDGKPPLSIAAGRGNATIVDLLLTRNDVEVNMRDNRGKTPLVNAILYGKVAAVKLLCGDSKVELNTEDNKGRDAFALAKEEQGRNSAEWCVGWTVGLNGEINECLEILRTAMETRARDGTQTTQAKPSWYHCVRFFA